MLRSRGIDMVIALDFSKSMLARDVRPNRIDRAKAELGRLLAEMDGTRVGVVAFAGETIEFPMTVDFAAVRLFLRDLGPYDLPVGGTAIGRALTAAQDLFERTHTGGRNEPAPSRVVILITDGEDHEGDPVEVATRLADQGTRVYVVGIGSEAGEPIPTYARDGTWTGYLRDESGELVLSALTPENEGTLSRVAEATGGRYIRAEGGTVGIDELRSEMGRMRQQERDSRRVTVHEDRYALLLFPGFLLLLLETLLPQAWLGRRRRKRKPTPNEGVA
jgi:Ca-activated chloride channel family protein